MIEGASAADPRAWRRGDLGIAAVPALLAAALWLLGRGADVPQRPVDTPAWARFRDHLLDGPDAGMWAANAAALVNGRLADLDGHRLPLFPRLSALLAEATGSVPLAGHLVAHLCLVGLGAVVYLLGVCWMSRGLAFGAAVAAVVYPPAVYASERFGVDPLVTLALPAALLAAEGAARDARFALPAGVLVGAFAGTHLTTLGIPVAAVVLVLLRGGRRRLRSAALCVAGIGLGLAVMFRNYPILPWDILVGTLSEGVRNGNPHGGGSSGASVSVSVLLAGLPEALERFVAYAAENARPAWVPWYPSLVLPWLGLVGALVGPGGWLARVGRGLGVGLPLALALAPPLAFAAAGAPERYTDNFHPLVVLLLFRGLDLLVGGVEAWAGTRPVWIPGAAGMITGLLAAAGSWSGGLVRAALDNPPTPEDTNAWRLGTLLAGQFPPGGGLASTNREAIAYAQRVVCPTSTGQKYWHDPEPARAWLRAECPGEGEIPYVVSTGPQDDRTPARRDLDRWVQANGRFVTELHLPGLDAWVYGVAR